MDKDFEVVEGIEGYQIVVHLVVAAVVAVVEHMQAQGLALGSFGMSPLCSDLMLFLGF